MTTLVITPNWKNKTARFKGTVAAGEHVSVTIQNDNGTGEPFIEDAATLRLRVIDPVNGRPLAIFPEPVPEGETPEAWGEEDLTPLTCTLNLNTVQMLKSVPPAANMPLLFVLDDYENKTLYFKELFSVEHWPRLRGEEEPVNLDDYADLIKDFMRRIDAAENTIRDKVDEAKGIVAYVAAAKTAAENARDSASGSATSAQTSATTAGNAATAAQAARDEAKSARDAINTPDSTLTKDGIAADAKTTGDKIAAEENRAKSVEATKADKIDTYTKTEVDTKIASVQTFGKVVVQTLPAIADADDKLIYLVPRADSETPDLCDEYVVVEEDGVRRWEQIGAKSVDLTLENTVTRTSANGVKSSGIWSAIWGALAALPTGFSSLYDWCVAQFAKYLPLTGGTLLGNLYIVGGNSTDATTLLRVKSGSRYVGFRCDRTSRVIETEDYDFVLPDDDGTLALAAPTPTSGHLAALDANGNPTDSEIPADNVALKSAIPYSLGTPIVIDTASSEVVEGETVYYGAATLADRTANIVQVTSATPLDELRISFPAATSGKVRDFELRVEIGTGSAALAAPALVPIAPTGETIKIENNAAEIPALAGGTATAKGATLLYFSETSPGVFLVKGEQVEEVA